MSRAPRPRVALAILPLRGASELLAACERLSPAARERIEEVYGFVFGPPPAAAPLPEGVRLFTNPRDLGWGGNKKVVLRYAQEKGFDLVLLAEGSALDPTDVERVLLRALEPPAPALVLGHRGSGGLLAKADRVAANLVLGVDHRAYSHPLQAIPRWALERVNFALDADDERFDVELLVQFRAARIDALEIELRGGGNGAARSGQRHALPSALAYRLHQLHVLRKGSYLPFGEVQYSFKESRFGSHQKIIERVRPGARVLDIGCSQGLLARDLRKKGVEVTGIDMIPRSLVRPEVDRYLACDLDHFTGADLQREFDYIICADILEHLRDPEALLRVVRRYLKFDGHLLASTGNIAVWFYRLSLLLGRFEYGPRGILDFTHTHLYTCDSFCRLIERAGFRIAARSYTSLPFEVFFESTGKSRLIRGIDALYHQAARIWPRMFAYQILVEAEVAALEANAGEGSV